MNRIALLVLAVAAFAAEDPWDKVRALKPGSEIRIYKSGARQPFVGKLDEVKADSVIVSSKTEQTSFAKENILRIDARGGSSGKPTVTRETKMDRNSIPETRPQPGPRNTPLPGGPSGSSSTGISFGGKGEFETVYTQSPAVNR
jgi:hypothetical protein